MTSPVATLPAELRRMADALEWAVTINGVDSDTARRWTGLACVARVRAAEVAAYFTDPQPAELERLERHVREQAEITIKSYQVEAVLLAIAGTEP